MKRSPLQPGKPMKRTGFAKAKPKAKKSSLQKSKDKMDSKYWDNQCHGHAKKFAHESPCLVCGRTEKRDGVMVAGHHLLRKSRSRLYRWDPLNVVALCEEHHLSGIEVCAHSDNPIAVAAFVETVKTTSPEQYAFMEAKAPELRQKDMRVGPKERPDWRAQAGVWKAMADAAELADCHRVWDDAGYGDEQ